MTHMSDDELKRSRERRLDAEHLQMIEGNPLTEDEKNLFEMFERERWSHERRLAYIHELAKEIARKADVVTVP